MNLRPVFLSAKWQNLLMVNWAVSPKLLEPYLPKGVELDFHNGETYVSLVAFQFLNTRVLGFKVPFHVNFIEVNLRFYVKRASSEGWRRGVVFISEYVPRFWIAAIAKNLYNENYTARKMTYETSHQDENIWQQYTWKINKDLAEVSFLSNSDYAPLLQGSTEEFIAEHYWGYTAQRGDSTIEYQVAHEPWLITQVSDLDLKLEFDSSIDTEIAMAVKQPVSNCFLAKGSDITVSKGERFS